MQELISVCIPTYNGAEYLEQAVRSAMNQTYTYIEILVIDDNSSDNPREIVNELSQQDTRIRLIINDDRLGLVQNWNKCLREAKGSWIKFLFQDDLMEPTALEKMLDLGLHFETNLVLSDRRYLCDDPERKIFFDGLVTLGNTLAQEEKFVKSERVIEIMMGNRLKHNFLGEPIVGLMHRSILNKYGFYDDRYSQIIDLEYWLRIATNEPIAFISEKLNVFRVHSKSVSSNNMKTKKPNPSYTDRILLVMDLLESDRYQVLRKEIGSHGIVQLHTILSFYVRKIGLITSMRLISWRVILKYNSGLFSLFK